MIYCPDKYKTQRRCDEAVVDSLAALKIIADWFVTSKMVKKIYIILYATDGLLFFDEDSGDVIFCTNEMGIFSVNYNDIIIDSNFNEDDPDTIILLSGFWLGIVNFKKCKALKKR